jgi:DNA-binding winged helix-turn-helix (wHTH) protein/tetratricopeptide (TPR) repeat protein
MAGRIYRFGRLRLDEARFELRRGEASIAIQPKPLDLLLYLLRHRDRVVSKEELLARLWPGVVVTDASLSRAVSAARRAVRDGGRKGSAIETVHGRGFRFVAPVEELTAGDDGAASERGGAEGVFIGREDVVAAVDGALAAARRGAGRLVLLSGSAGMGKTRTALEAVARARRAGVPVLMSWCSEDGGTPDLRPWVHLLRQLLARHDVAPLVRGLGDAMADLAEHLPILRPHAPSGGGARPDPEQARFRLLEAIIEMLERAARAAPHLVILDDAQWADRDSLTLLRFLGRGLPATGLALLVTYRQEEVTEGHPLLELARAPACEPLALAGLDVEEVAALVAAELGECAEPTLVQAIRQRTQGNPFFVKEIARALRTRGRPWDAHSLLDVPLSAGIHQVLWTRMGRLSPDCRELLALCAVMGPEIELAPVARASGRVPAAVLALLDEARAAHVVEKSGDGWRFAHALVRDALLERMPASERARRHRQIGLALEAFHADDLEPHVGELAHHFCAGAPAGDGERAVDYARRAGHRAARLLAYGDAAGHYEQALDALALSEEPDGQARADLLLALGEARMFSGEPALGRETLARAADAARRLGSPTHLARVALASGGLELSGEVGVCPPSVVALFEEALQALPSRECLLGVRLLARLAVMLLWSDWRRSDGLVRQAVEHARRLGDPVALAYALYGRHWAAALEPTNLSAQLSDADEIVTLAARTESQELELTGQSLRFLTLLELGRLGEAEAALTAYEELAARGRVPRYRARANYYRSSLAFLAGRFAEVEERALRRLAEEERFRPGDAGLVGAPQLFWLRREQGRARELEPALRTFAARFTSLDAAWQPMLGLLHVEMGRHEDARRTIDALAADDFAAVPRHFLGLPALVGLGELCAALGDAPRAARLHELLQPYRPRTVVVGAGVLCVGSLDLFLGRLAATAGRREAAARHLETALETNRRLGARPWVGWAEYELARLLGDADRDRARGHAGRARETADALGMVRLAQRCGELAASRS